MFVMTEDHVLTERQEQLLDALRTAGAWVNRADLATATGKNRLSPHDLMLLERLEEMKLIEVRQERVTALLPEFQYRAK